MSEKEIRTMYEIKRSFVFALGKLLGMGMYRVGGLKGLQYAYDMDSREEGVQLKFEGGAVREISVTGDSLLAILKDIVKVLD